MTPRKAPAKKAAPRKAPAKTVRKTAAKPARKAAPAKKAPAKKSAAVKRTGNARENVPNTIPPDVTSKLDLTREPEVTPAKSAAELQALAARLTPDGVADPPQLAWEAKQRGYTWEQAARIAGFESAQSARTAAMTYVDRVVAEAGPARRREALELADSRLQAMIGNWTERARMDVGAANLVLSANRDLMKLWRLGEPDAASTTERVIVIAGSEQEYLAGLQKVVLEREQARETKALPAPGPTELEG